MTDIIIKGEKRLVVISGRAHPELVRDVVSRLGTGVLPSTTYDFVNGGIYARFNESMRGCDVLVIQSHNDRANDWLMEWLIMADAPRRVFAKRITVVAPFFSYARQDKKHLGRKLISTRLVVDLYKTASADHLMSVDLHTSQEQGLFDGFWDHLQAQPVFVDYVRTRVDPANAAAVSPNAGHIQVTERWANQLGGTPLAFVHKIRDVTRPSKSVANRVIGDIEGRSCVLVDDMTGTGDTVAKAVQMLLDSGTKDVIVTATHGALFGPAADQLFTCGAREVIITGTLPIPADKYFEQLTVLPITPLLTRAARAVFDDGSVAELLDAVGIAGD